MVHSCMQLQDFPCYYSSCVGICVNVVKSWMNATLQMLHSLIAMYECNNVWMQQCMNATLQCSLITQSLMASLNLPSSIQPLNLPPSIVRRKEQTEAQIWQTQAQATGGDGIRPFVWRRTWADRNFDLYSVSSMIQRLSLPAIVWRPLFAAFTGIDQLAWDTW